MGVPLSIPHCKTACCRPFRWLQVGSPERPLSDLGAVSYRSYWTRVILEMLRDHKTQMSIKVRTLFLWAAGSRAAGQATSASAFSVDERYLVAQSWPFDRQLLSSLPASSFHICLTLVLQDISELTAIRTDDVVKTLEGLGLIKYWKGDHIISVTQKVWVWAAGWLRAGCVLHASHCSSPDSPVGG